MCARGRLFEGADRLEHGVDRDMGGAFGREAVDARRDGRERDAPQLVFGRQLEARAVAARE